MAGTTQTSGSSAVSTRHIHHGRTGAAWAGTTIAMLAFILGAIGILIGNWMIFWIAAALVVVALIVTMVLRKMGYGAG